MHTFLDERDKEVIDEQLNNLETNVDELSKDLVDKTLYEETKEVPCDLTYSDGYIRYYDGKVISENSHKYTNEIPVKSGDRFIINGWYGMNVTLVGCYSNGSYLMDKSVHDSTQYIRVTNYEFIVPDGVDTIILSSVNMKPTCTKTEHVTIKDKIAEITSENEKDYTVNIVATGGESNFLNDSGISNKSLITSISDFFKKVGRTTIIDNCIKGYNVKAKEDSIGGNYSVEFDYDGSEFHICTEDTFLLRIKCFEYGKWTDITGILSHQNHFNRIAVRFNEEKNRTFKIEIKGKLYGFVVDATKTLCYPSITYKPLCIIEGTSITASENIIGFRHSSWGNKLCELMDFDFVNCGVGGTGYVSKNDGTYCNYQERIDFDIVDAKPEYAIIEGGRNDSIYMTSDESKKSELFEAVRTCIDKVKNGSPNTKLVLVGRYQEREVSGTTKPNSAIYSENTYDTSTELFICNDIIRAVALEKNVPFIDLMRGQAVDGNGNIIIQTRQMMTGTGWVANPQNNGNSDVYVGSTNFPSDSTHLNEKGQEYMGRYVYSLYQAILKTM